MTPTLRPLVPALVALVALTACAAAPDAAPTATDASAPANDSTTTARSAGVRVVAPEEAAAIAADPPADLVVLDVRTPEEFAEGHLADALLIDFYEPDFGAQLAQLDRDVPYVLYCRSGNRSGQAREMMSELGFVDVADVDGGIIAWAEAGLPLDG